MSSKIIYCCQHCGSDNISADAVAFWDAESQSWQVSGVMDDGHSCDDCGKDTALIEQPLNT